MEILKHVNPMLCLLTGSLVSVCVVGDYLLVKVSNMKNVPLVVRAGIDNLTHAAVALLSWQIAAGAVKKELVLCGVVASLVDIDHFAMARSFSLADAVSLKHRPPLHNSLLLGVVSAGMLAVGTALKSKGLTRLSWLFAVAWTSHHIRDGYRHGLWFGPWSTPPYPQWAYILAVALIPLVLRLSLYDVHARTLPALDV